MYYLSIMMKSRLFLPVVLLSVFTLSSISISCKSTKVEEPATPAPAPAPVVEEAPKVEPEPAIQEEPVVQPQEDDEYTRSVGSVAVDRNTFTNDKEEIQRIIKTLDGIMKDMDYKSWVTYVDQESIDHWSNPSNLKKAQNRLPVKGLKLKSLRDYFRFVFVPARVGKEITEIRYISDTYVKAVQVRDEQDDLVYYYFNKIDGHWMVHIPPIED